MSEDKQRGEDVLLVKQASQRLSENFDSVVIMATRRIPSGTRNIVRTEGNFFASYGLAKLWIEDQNLYEPKQD